MARREAYTEVNKKDFTRPDHVKGMGDRVFRGYQCLNRDCVSFVFVPEAEITDDFSFQCEVCGHVLEAGEAETVYQYELVDKRDGSVIEEGPFEILHDDYLKEAERFKYCIICACLKPLDRFDRHRSRASGRQGECNLCKAVYNGLKNQTRLVEQHREASQKRRLYVQFESGKLDLDAIYERFGHKCFKCGLDLSADVQESKEGKVGNLDHTLPAFYLWPLTTNNATLLCREHNGEKAEKWPSAFYNEAELRRLAALTGIDYRQLASKPMFNPEAVSRLKSSKFVVALFEKFARYPEELLRLRNRILDAEGFDFLDGVKNLSPEWKARANALHKG